MRSTTKRTVAKARALRRTMSPPEEILWTILRQRPQGVKFRRQHPLGPFILDFYCPAARLGVEVDGAVHDMGNNPERDAKRDAWLREHGVTIVRFIAEDVIREPESVLKEILASCAAGPSTALRAVPLPISPAG
ncbi:endonuclease domain-containing protein [Sphingomonas parva]|uniref:endonuclease domain-containing protein n=1 Tax=Sphingomonas parva TaxID=2555898 RepID=UPI001CDC2A01|nr:endonuclease domain-containing protein [Sphingomonas parva]